jgi:hypothetical protein
VEEVGTPAVRFVEEVGSHAVRVVVCIDVRIHAVAREEGRVEAEDEDTDTLV